MIKRLVWWSSGAVMGAGGSLWARRKVHKAIDAKVEQLTSQLRPTQLLDAARTKTADVVASAKQRAGDAAGSVRQTVAGRASH